MIDFHEHSRFWNIQDSTKKYGSKCIFVRKIVRKPMFVLDKPKSDKPTYILLKKTFLDGVLKYSLKRKIHPDNWDSKQQRAFPSVKDRQLSRECSQINDMLDVVEDRVGELGKITKVKAVWEINELLGLPNKFIETNTLFQVIDETIRCRREGKELTNSGKKFSKGTITAYGQSLGFFKEFEATGGRIGIDMTPNDYEAFFSFLCEKKLAVNTIGKTVTHLKTFLRVAKKKDYPVPILDKGVIKKVSEDAFDIYLSNERVIQLYQTPTNTRYETLAKEWFAIGCFTGLRVSDLVLLSKDKVLKDKITVANEKTDVRVVLPIHWVVREIYNKYGDFPPDIPDQKLNKFIKKVAEKAGFKDKVSYSMTKGGERVDITKFEYEMISTHTGRRSFITNLLKDGLSPSIVMRLTGIKDSRTLQKYDKITAEEVADIVSKHSSFQKPE